MSVVKHTLSFAGGELSPWLDGRTDIEKYAAGCRLLLNNIPLPQGGYQKRPGMQYVDKMPPLQTGRLVDFQVSTTDAVMMVIGAGVIAIYSNGVRALDGVGAPIAIPIPWANYQLPQLRWKQINSVMYFVHPGFPPQKLTRYAADDWELKEVDYSKKPALLPENVIDEHTITVGYPAGFPVTALWVKNVQYLVGQKVTYPAGGDTWKCMKKHTSQDTKPPGVATYTETLVDGRLVQTVIKPTWIKAFSDLSAVEEQEVLLTASRDTWEAGHVGSIWEIAKKRAITTFEVELRLTAKVTTSPQYSEVLVIQGGWTFFTSGTWNGSFTIEKSEDRGVTWEGVRSWTANNDRNVTGEGEEEQRVLMRVKWEKDADETTKGYTNPTSATLTSSDPKIRGLVKIKTFTDARSVIATVITPTEIATTYSWSESAWNAVQGYPRVIELHQGRVVTAATTKRPHSVWGSADDDYEDFYIGSLATDAYFHTLAIGERDPILWMISEKFLLIGTGSGEWVMRGEDEDKPIVPEFGVAVRHSSYGTHNGGTPACFADSVSLFVQRGGTRVREFAYRYEQDRYEAADLTILANHLFEAPIDDIAVMRMPWQVVWFVSDGKLYGLTYERAQQVIAWHRHETLGTVISVATIRGAGLEDEVWFLVIRNNRVFVERFAPGQLANPTDDGTWMDSWVKMAPPYDVSAATNLTGRTVTGFCDRVVYPPVTLSGSVWPFITYYDLELTFIDGAGESINVGGRHFPRGIRNGKFWWAIRDDLYETNVQWVVGTAGQPSRWIHYIGGTAVFESTENVDYPHQVVTWVQIGTLGTGEFEEPPVWTVVSLSPDFASGVRFYGTITPDVTDVMVPFSGLNGDGDPNFELFTDALTILVRKAFGAWTIDVGIDGVSVATWLGVGDVASPMLVTTWTPIAGTAAGNPAVVAVPLHSDLNLVLGLPYSSAMQPMTAEIPLSNGSSRSRETRIHKIVPSLRFSRGGKFGENPDGPLDPLKAGSEDALFTGEIEREFDGGHNTGCDVCLVSDEPFPFAVRTLCLKMNIYGDAD